MAEMFQRIAVHALIIDGDKRMLVTHRSADNDHSPDTYDTFGGSVEMGEKLEDGLVREVEEESGLQVEIVRVLDAYDGMSGPLRHQIQITYLCRKPEGEIVYEDHDHDSHRWVNLDELIALPNKMPFLEQLCQRMVEKRIVI
ncbi:NUDIX hydrolase [Candidatus Shapirobacteria bacterium]|nr:NUDIX hydrolase [Candidatus Shapirobacteria bacterium]